MSFLLIFFSAIPALLTGLFLVIFFNARINELVQENIESAAHWHAADVQTFMKSNEDNLKTLVEIIDPAKLLIRAENLINGDFYINEPQPIFEDNFSNEKINTRKIINAWSDTQEQVNRISLINKDNQIVLSSEKQIEGKVSTMESAYLSNLMEGEFVVTRVYSDLYADEQKSFNIAQPLFNKGEYVGFLMFSMNLSYINNIVSQAQFFDTGTVMLLDSENKIVADNGRNTLSYPELSSLNERIAKNTEKADTLLFKYLRTAKTVCFFKMTSRWTVICMVDPNEFDFPSSAVMLIVALIGVVFTITVFLLRMVMVKIFTKPLEKLLSYLHNINKNDYVIRIPHLGRNEFSEIATAFNNLMTRIQADKRELAIKEERYRIANEQSNSIIFEYNVETGDLSCSPNANEFANYPAFTNNFPESLVDLEVVHPEDVPQYQRVTHGMTHGRRHGTMEIRMRTNHSDYHWFNMSLTTITDSETFKPLRIIGKLNDIDEEKRMTENLTFKAERDPLTSVLNKAATQMLITKRIAERKPELYYAFIVLDIDCFKSINDGYGHQKGDGILVELASSLTNQLRGEDVVGRIGGDEFMILLTDMPSKDAVSRKAEQLLCAIRNIAINAEDQKYVAASMGIAFCPQDGISFSQLYASADNALYARKKSGKNGFSFFSE